MSKLIQKLKGRIKQMKLTKAEKIILKNTDKIYTYIARDVEGHLILFSGKPIKRKPIGEWETFYPNIWFGAFDHLFKSIQWEDEEPYKFR